MGLASKKTGMQKYSQLPHITQIYNMCVAQHFDVETEEFFQPEVWNHCIWIRKRRAIIILLSIITQL